MANMRTPACTFIDRAEEITRELGRLTSLRDEIDVVKNLDNLRVQERVRRLGDRIASIEEELSFRLASSLPGALGQALVAYADISYMLESEFEPEAERPMKERLRRLIWSIAKCLEQETGIDVEALAGSYSPSGDPLEDFVPARAS